MPATRCIPGRRQPRRNSFGPSFVIRRRVKRNDVTKAKLTDRVGLAVTETYPNATLRLEGCIVQKVLSMFLQQWSATSVWSRPLDPRRVDVAITVCSSHKLMRRGRP